MTGTKKCANFGGNWDRIGIEVIQLGIFSFQERLSKPFIRLIKGNISRRFRSSSKDVISLQYF